MAVFPCSDKMPLLKHGLLDASTDRATVERWFARVWPAAQIAVRTGRESGLLVVDVDGEEGADALHELERVHGQLPPTATVKTPGAGQHFYLLHPGGEIPNSAGKIGPGIDIRCDGGYVIAPPSIGPDGRRYEVDERAPLAPVPGWLLTLIASGAGAREAAPASRWLALVAGVDEGQRNVELASLAGHLLRRYIDVDLAAELLHLVNQHRCRPPLPDSAVDVILDSIAGREARRRERAHA